MLSLSDIGRWEQLRASSGASGALARTLLVKVSDGDNCDWPELYHQACHQHTLADVAFAIVPHAVRIAGQRPVQERLWALEIAGTVVACLDAFPSRAPAIPPDLGESYAAGIELARKMVLDCLGHQSWSRGDAVRLMAAGSAFQGLTNLAIHLFLHGGSDHELHCPMCGEYIRWSEG